MAGFGITITDVSGDYVSVSADALNGGEANVVTSSPPNFLQPPYGRTIAYTLEFDFPLDSLSLTRAAYCTYLAYPPWDAVVKDTYGTVLGTVSESGGSTSASCSAPYPPTEVFTFSGPGIKSLTVNSGHFDFYGRTGPAFDDVILSYTASDNQPPVPKAGPDQTVIIGEDITFDGSASYDPDGTIASYEWDFDDGDIGFGAITTHVYTSAGIYAVTLTVTDDEGATGTDSLTMTVQTPAEATQDLISYLEDLDLPRGTENSLVAKLKSVIKSLDKGHDNAAINKLNAFINQVEAQEGKKITGEQAAELIATAQWISASLTVGD